MPQTGDKLDRPYRLAALILALFCAGGAQAQQVMPRLVTPDEAAGWTGVGALLVAGNPSCTAVLISDHEAITAAHCVVDRATATPVDPALFRLVLGQTADGFAAMRGVQAAAFLPGYLTTQDNGLATLALDLALLTLDTPVLPDEATPLPPTDWQDICIWTLDGAGRPQAGSTMSASGSAIAT